MKHNESICNFLDSSRNGNDEDSDEDVYVSKDTEDLNDLDQNIGFE